MKKKQLDLASFKYELKVALNRANRDFVVRELNHEQEEYVVDHYYAVLLKHSVDKKSFPKSFDPKKCHSKIVNKIYGMNGRYVKIKLSNQELAACKKYGLKVVSTIYKIYKPRAHCNK